MSRRSILAARRPATGLFVDTYEGVAADTYAVTNAIFFGNAPERDLATACDSNCAPIKGAVSYSMAQSKYTDGSIKIAFGAGIIAPADPLFVAPDTGDFHLQAGSPAIGKGDGGSDLGAYGVGGAAQSVESAPAEPATPAPAKTAEEESPAPVAADPEPATPAPAAGASPATPAPTDQSAAAPDGDVSAKDAFAAAKELGTADAWNAFLASYPKGFLADLARAYLNKLGAAPSGAPAAPAAEPAAEAAQTPAPADAAPSVASSDPAQPAVARGGEFMGFPEKFNRYYTDPAWKPSQTLYVSPDGSGDGASRDAPMSVKDAVAAARPGTMIYFLRGAYTGCFEFTKETQRHL